MDILVDGIVYGFQRHGGINTYFNEVTPRIAQIGGCRVSVLIPMGAVGAPPRCPVVRLTRDPVFFQTGVSWQVDNLLKSLYDQANGLLSELRARSRRECVFHSTYFTYLKGSIPQVASVYDLNHERFPDKYDTDWGQWLRRQYRDYVKRATRVIAISEQTRQDVIRYYGVPADKIDVTHLAVCPRVFHPDRSLEAAGALADVYGIDRPYFFYVGSRNTVYKNFQALLEAFAHSGLGDDFLLVAAGQDWKSTERELIGRLGVADSVRMVIQPDDATIRNLYSSSLAFVYPSLHEGFGIPLLEAMACETMVLAADTAVFREVAAEAACYFDPLDLASLGKALECATQPATRSAYVARGRARVKVYSWDRCARETYSVYLKALAS